jgi:hypothetical protein
MKTSQKSDKLKKKKKKGGGVHKSGIYQWFQVRNFHFFFIKISLIFSLKKTYIRISRVENGPGWLNELGSWIT